MFFTCQFREDPHRHCVCVFFFLCAYPESHTGRETTCFDIHGGCRLLLRDEDVTKFAININGAILRAVFDLISHRIGVPFLVRGSLSGEHF